MTSQRRPFWGAGSGKHSTEQRVRLCEGRWSRLITAEFYVYLLVICGWLAALLSADWLDAELHETESLASPDSARCLLPAP